MTSSLLLFTFSPIQSFIQEARRAEDLFNGSAILSDLAKSAAQPILDLGNDRLVYPAPPLKSDVPNVLVAHLTEEMPEEIAKKAKRALEDRWKKICAGARGEMTKLSIPIDKTWEDIWDQQVNAEKLWEIYWVVVPFDEKGYAKAYSKATAAVDALKRSRIFREMEEKGQKDSLSGKRAALRTASYKKAKDYWAYVASLEDVYPSKVRPNGRERLDAIGAVKRFAEIRNEPFDSTSTVAAADFLARAKAKAKAELAAYHTLLMEKFTEKEVFRPYKNTKEKKDWWSYDGDLLYETTLTVERFRSDYHFQFSDKDPRSKQKEKVLEEKLNECRDFLKGNKDREKKVTGIYEKADRPSPYYAILALDGDSMGKKIDELLNNKDKKPEDAHKEFSKRLGEFSQRVKEIVEEHLGFLVYNGGDDVMCMAPLSQAIPLAIALREAFRQIVGQDVTISAGIAISHHQSPLDFAIEEARKAEQAAKNQAGRDAICVHVLKRSGEPLEVRSKWDDMQTVVEELRDLFANNMLSSRLAYSVQRDASILSSLETKARASMLKVVLTRQSSEKFDQADKWADKLIRWADNMDRYLPHKKDSLGNDEGAAGFTEMANWLVFARFLSLGGGE